MNLKMVLSVFCVFLLFASPFAYAHIEAGVTITSISFGGKAYAGEEVEVLVGVVEIVMKEGKAESVPPGEKVKVTAEITKGDKRFDLVLNPSENGEYAGKIALPETGQWTIIATAEYEGTPPQTSENAGEDDHFNEKDTFDAALQVHDPAEKQQAENQAGTGAEAEGNNAVLWIVLALIAAAAVVVISKTRRKSGR
jgi:hypothetical protein